MLGKKLIQAASGSAAAGGGLGVEDVFSTWLYTGNSSTQTITNGIDLAGEGGMVWCKYRTGGNISTASHGLFDTVRGANNALRADLPNGTYTSPGNDLLTSFTSSGFSLGADATAALVNRNNATYASWTFRKAPGFFDVVTYTGNSVNGRTISHNLGSVPGVVIVKCTSTSTTNWAVYHRSLSIGDGLLLNSPDQALGYGFFPSAPTATEFTVSAAGDVNTDTRTYVAYLFAHDEQIFGEGGDQSVIKCGSYAGNGSTTGPTVSLGWEPQWLLIKRSSGVADWVLIDNMRGFSHTSNEWLSPNTSALASTTSAPVVPLSTGFQPRTSGTDVNGGGSTYIYIAIRRGPMKTPTSGTEVFDLTAYTGNATVDTSVAGSASFPVEAVIVSDRDAGSLSWSSYAHYLLTRLTGYESNRTTLNLAAVGGWAQYWDWAASSNIGSWGLYGINSSQDYLNKLNNKYTAYKFRRAPGFFDVVAYTGTGVNRTVPHNLSVAPELFIVKRRNGNGAFATYSSFVGATHYLALNDNAAATPNNLMWNDTAPTDSVFTVGTQASTNASGGTYIAYLFATCPGVSKVGSYTGTGTTLDIDCGFTSGARFVLIKRTDTQINGQTYDTDWYVWDTARGITSGNDPYLTLNEPAAEVTGTDFIDPLSSGFQISSTAPAAINASGGTFVFLAIS